MSESWAPIGTDVPPPQPRRSQEIGLGFCWALLGVPTTLVLLVVVPALDSVSRVLLVALLTMVAVLVSGRTLRSRHRRAIAAWALGWTLLLSAGAVLLLVILVNMIAASMHF